MKPQIDINSATDRMLELLPNMDINVAAEIIDWRGIPMKTSPRLPTVRSAQKLHRHGWPTVPYYAKDAPFESDR